MFISDASDSGCDATVAARRMAEGLLFRTGNEQGRAMMILDLTAELAPVLWGMIGLTAASALAILAAALPAWTAPQSLNRQRQRPRQVLTPGPLSANCPARS